jgi:hypothetical protein
MSAGVAHFQGHLDYLHAQFRREPLERKRCTRGKDLVSDFDRKIRAGSLHRISDSEGWRGQTMLRMQLDEEVGDRRNGWCIAYRHWLSHSARLVIIGVSRWTFFGDSTSGSDGGRPKYCCYRIHSFTQAGRLPYHKVLEPDTPHSLNPRARLRPSIDDARDIAKRFVEIPSGTDHLSDLSSVAVKGLELS